MLVLIPDHPRALPLPFLFRALVDVLHNAKQVDFMAALGTHPPLSDESINKLVGITAEEQTTTFRHIGLLNHAWDTPSTLVALGTMEQDEIKQIAGKNWHSSLPATVDIRINKAALEYDHVIILGPTFAHEVGFSGGAKYLFPGVSGPDMINATHLRAMIHAAASRLKFCTV